MRKADMSFQSWSGRLVREKYAQNMVNYFLIAMEPTTSGPQDKINHGKAMGAINNFLVAEMKEVNPQKPKDCMS